VSSFVLIPGACHGGWWYEPLVSALRQEGHQACALTLAGLGPDGMAAAGQVNLTTHVAEATAAVTGAGEPVVLVGHLHSRDGLARGQHIPVHRHHRQSGCRPGLDRAPLGHPPQRPPRWT
jgi:hypothetical protein